MIASVQATPDYVRSAAANWPWFVVALAVVWPALHFLYNKRIEALKEDIERLRSRIEDMMASGTTVPSASSAEQQLDAKATNRSAALVSPKGSHNQPAKTEAAPAVPYAPAVTVSANALRPTDETTYGRSDWRYPAYLGIAPQLTTANRVFLASNAIEEITSASRSLPPLRREEGIVAAYGGRWIRGRGTIKRIAKGIDTYGVLLVDAKGFWINLTFPSGQLNALESFREGETVEFEGRLRAADHTSVELVYPQMTRAT